MRSYAVESGLNKTFMALVEHFCKIAEDEKGEKTIEALWLRHERIYVIAKKA